MKKKSKVYEHTIPKKVKSIHLIFSVFAILLALFAFRWQVIGASKFDLLAKNRVQNQTLNSMRGSIFSKDGTTLAYTEPRVKVTIWLPDLIFYERDVKSQTREELITKVAPIIETTKEELTARIDLYIAQGTNHIVLGNDLSKDQWDQIKNIKTEKNPNLFIQGFSYEFLPKRIYPEGRTASHLVGLANLYSDVEIVGTAGLERSFTDILKPVKGLITQETDARGIAITSTLLQTIEPRNGSDIYITINKKLQNVVQEKLKEGVEKYDAKSGTVIIQDPKTGEVMALANYPDYDPNIRAETDPAVYGNLAITSPFETGSIGKILTIATAIDLKLITPETIILPNGHEGCEKIHNELAPLCTWDKKPQPPMPAKDCFQKSDNICFYHISEMIPRKDFFEYLRAFGVGETSGIQLKEESTGGLLKNFNDWNIGDVAAYSYGHGYLMNSMQAINASASIANFGVRMQPNIIDKVISAEGEETAYLPTVLKRVVTNETAETVTSMMRYNFNLSLPEWYYQDLNNYNIGVKSGTALIANTGGYTTNINATFVGFDASSQRTFTMIVRLEDPKIPDYDRLAFYNVRPLWLDIFSAVKDIIGVPRK